MSLDIFWQIVMLLFLMAVGYAACKARVLTSSLQRGISNLVIHVALPASIIGSAKNMQDSGSTAEIATIFVGAVIYFVVAIVIMELGTRWLSIEHKQKVALRLMVVFTNCAFIGYPILSVFLPDNGVFYGSFFLLASHIALFTYALGITSGKSSVSFKSIVFNINNIASLCMLIMFLFGISLPIEMTRGLDLLGGLCTPLSMLVVGGMLASVKLKRVFTLPIAYLASLLRLIVIPSLVFLALRVLGIGGAAGTVLLLQSGMPCSGTVVMLAEKGDCAPETVANGAMLSTLLFMGTIAYLVFLQSML